MNTRFQMKSASGTKRRAQGRWAAMIYLATLPMVCGLGASTPARADGPGWTALSTVKELVVTGNGGVNVRLAPELANCVSQSGYGAAFASIYGSHPGINRIKADLLAALLSGKQVRLYLSDNTCTVSETILVG